MTFPDLPCPHCGELVRLANMPAFADPPPASPVVAVDETKLAGPDGEPISELLAVPKAFAMGAIVQASLAATERARAGRRVDSRFWSPTELGDVAASLSGLMGYSDLIGRARIRLYQRAARGESRAFASPKRKGFVALRPDWSILTPLRNIGRAILESLESLAKFVADIFGAVDFVPAGWPEFYKNLGFQRAVDTEAVVRDKVQGKLDDSPEELPSAEDILNDIGVGPTNPSYPTVVVDINSHERLNIGGQDEQAKPDVAADLPAWQYHAVIRPTSRPHHAARDGNFYPSGTRFEDVRGHGPEEEANCLCSWTPLGKAQAGDTGLAFADNGRRLPVVVKKPFVSPWKEPVQAFAEALNAGIREAVAESGRATLEAIRAIPKPPAPVVNFTPPEIKLPPPAPIHYTPPPIELPQPAAINYTPPPIVLPKPDPPPVVKPVKGPPALTAADVAAVARREAEASTQTAVGALTPILDKVIALASKPPTPERPAEDAEFFVEPQANGTTKITKLTASGATEFTVEQQTDGKMKITRKAR